MKVLIFLIFFTFFIKISYSIELNNTLSTSYNFYPHNLDGSINSKKSSELKVEAYYDKDRFRFASEIIGRIDSEDSGRRIIEAREAFINSMYNNLDFFIGHRQVFWGVAESKNVVDIINQKDNAANQGNDAKLGAPSISIEKLTDFGDFQIWYLPKFRNRTFNDSDSHPSNGLDVKSSSYERKNGQNADDLALRLSSSMDDWDYAGSLFYGTAREPLFKSSNSNNGLQAFYPKLKSLGLEGQFTGEEMLLKWESLSGKQSDEHFFSLVSGLEYTSYNVLKKKWDLGIILEYQFDDRAQSVSNEFFVLGKRIIFNDTLDSNILALFSFDNNLDQSFLSIEGSRRLNEWSSIELTTRFYNARKIASYYKQLSDDDEIQLKLKIYF